MDVKVLLTETIALDTVSSSFDQGRKSLPGGPAAGRDRMRKNSGSRLPLDLASLL